jgi:hypothetical protein
MLLTVKERGQFAATMRHVHVWLMETLAAWVPTTPEMEVKLLFGEHIWDAAQHADALGKRTFELRMPLQQSMRPAEAYAQFLAELTGIAPTPQRLAAVYDVLLPALAQRYRRYLDETDALSDAPTVRIVERYLGDSARMVEAGRALRQELPPLQLADQGWAETLRKREAMIDRILAPRAGEIAVDA